MITLAETNNWLKTHPRLWLPPVGGVLYTVLWIIAEAGRYNLFANVVLFALFGLAIALFCPKADHFALTDRAASPPPGARSLRRSRQHLMANVLCCDVRGLFNRVVDKAPLITYLTPVVGLVFALLAAYCMTTPAEWG